MKVLQRSPLVSAPARPRPGYFLIIALQGLITIGVAALWAVFKGPNAALSALVGGLVCLVPSALFAVRLWAAGKKAETGADAWAFGFSFAVGELVKVLATGIGFVLVFKLYKDVDAVPFFVGFIAALHGYLFSLLIDRRG